MTHIYGSNVPLARTMIANLSDDLWNGRVTSRTAANILTDIEKLLHRHKPVRHAPKLAKLTPEIRREIKRLAAANPKTTEQSIGYALGVSGGRVSEVLHGH